MHQQAGALDKAFPTLLTFMRLLPSVDSPVVYKMGDFAEMFTTHITFIKLFSRRIH